MGRFDQAVRYGAKLEPAGFLSWLVPNLDQGVVMRGWLDTRTLPFPGEPDRVCDTVAFLEDATSDAPPWAFVIDFQVEPAVNIPERTLEYLVRIRAELRPYDDRHIQFRVAAAVVNLTGPTQSGKLEMYLPGLNDTGLRWQVRVRTLSEESAAQTVEAIATGTTAACIAAWIPLMNGGDQPELIDRWKQVVEQQVAERTARNTLAGLAIVFAELTKCRDRWQLALEGWNVYESPVIEEWVNLGETRGEVKTRRAVVTDLLRDRLGVELPTELIAAINAITSLDSLKRLYQTALACSSLDEFRTVLDSVTAQN